MEGTVATEDVACEDAEADVENAGVVGGEDIPDSRDRDVDSGVGGIAGGGDGGAVVVVVVVAVAVAVDDDVNVAANTVVDDVADMVVVVVVADDGDGDGNAVRGVDNLDKRKDDDKVLEHGDIHCQRHLAEVPVVRDGRRRKRNGLVEVDSWSDIHRAEVVAVAAAVAEDIDVGCHTRKNGQEEEEEGSSPVSNDDDVDDEMAAATATAAVTAVRDCHDENHVANIRDDDYGRKAVEDVAIAVAMDVVGGHATWMCVVNWNWNWNFLCLSLQEDGVPSWIWKWDWKRRPMTCECRRHYHHDFRLWPSCLWMPKWQLPWRWLPWSWTP